MDYELTIQQKAGYLHIIATGQNSREAVAAYLMCCFQECVARSCPRVLIEARLLGPHLPLWDIFEIAAQHSSLDMGFLEAIAYVDINDPPELAEFIENVTRNRGLPLRVFPSVAAAEECLVAGIKERSSLPAPSDKLADKVDQNVLTSTSRTPSGQGHPGGWRRSRGP